MEVSVHPTRGGAASSWRDARPAVFAASGAHRAKSFVAGGKAVSVELAVVEPPLLWDAAGGGHLGRDYGPGRSGQVSGTERKVAGRARDVEGRLPGGVASASHAGQTPRRGTLSKAVPARGAKAHHGASDFFEGTDASGSVRMQRVLV